MLPGNVALLTDAKDVYLKKLNFNDHFKTGFPLMCRYDSNMQELELSLWYEII